MVEDIREKEILFLFDAWKYTFSLRTLGGGYRRYLLFFSDDNLIEMETNNISHVPPFKYAYKSDDIISNFFWNMVDTIFKRIKGHVDKLNKDIYQGKMHKLKDFLELLSKNKVGYNIKNVIPYSNIKYIKIENKGSVSLLKDDCEILLEIQDEKKKRFEIYFPKKSIYENSISVLQSLIPADKLKIK